jgi:hypothetical protein
MQITICSFLLSVLAEEVVNNSAVEWTQDTFTEILK